MKFFLYNYHYSFFIDSLDHASNGCATCHPRTLYPSSRISWLCKYWKQKYVKDYKNELDSCILKGFDESSLGLTKDFFSTDPSMPVFQDAACPENAKLPKDRPEDFPENPDLCVEVLMPNSEKDMLVLARVPGTSIYEGYLGNELDVPVVLIDVPSTNKRVVSVSLPLKYSQYVIKGFHVETWLKLLSYFIK